MNPPQAASARSRPHHRGEVWWADNGGKVRPVVITTRNGLVRSLTSLIVVPCTSTVRGVRSEVPLGPSDGLPQSCVANTLNVTTLPVTSFRSMICQLDEPKLDALCAALNWSQACSFW